MQEFHDVPESAPFESWALPYLLAATQQFFGCKAHYSSKPIATMKASGVDIAANPRRGIYPIDNSTIVVLGRLLDGRDLKAAFSLTLRDGRFDGLGYLLSAFEAAIAVTLSRSSQFGFRDRPQQFGDELLQLAISRYFSKGYFDPRLFLLMLDLFRKLSTTTFEGRNFTTGLILTPSHYAYAEKRGYSRGGKVFPLAKDRPITPGSGVDRRFWYLADGKTSFFMADRRLNVRDLFVLDAPRRSLTSFIDDYSLSNTIMGRDALFRVISRAEYSVLTSEQIEFCYKDNHWHVRNIRDIANQVRSALDVDEKFVECFLYFVFLLSRRRCSAILCVPRDMAKVEDVMLSRNSLTEPPFSILDEAHTQTIFRLLSSDGATIIAKDGAILSFGSVVDISKVSVSGVRGTGETAATLLASHGLAVKVSQDGVIRIYTDAERPPIVF